MRFATAFHCGGCATKMVACSADSSFNAAIPRETLKSYAFPAAMAADLGLEVGRATAPLKRVRNETVARWVKSIVSLACIMRDVLRSAVKWTLRLNEGGLVWFRHNTSQTIASI